MSWTEIAANNNTVRSQYDEKTGQTAGFNKNGEITYRKTDSDGNGINEELIFYSNETNGRQIVQRDNETGRTLTNSSYIDDQCVYSETYEYNENGNIANVNIDGNGDGQVDFITKYNYDKGKQNCETRDVRPLGTKIKDFFENIF